MEIKLKQLLLGVKTLADEKNLAEDTVQDAIEAAMAAAWRKDFGERDMNVTAKLNQKTGDLTVFIHKDVVEEVEDEDTQITLKEAQKIDKDVELEGEVTFEEHPTTFGRVAAQTAKQVLLQRLRESEREVVMEEYEDKIGYMVNGTVARVESRLVRVDLGRGQGIMPVSEQIRGEYYSVGQRLKVYLKDIDREGHNPQLILSRATPKFIAHLFESEVPEMENGAVEIKLIAREAGVRTKLAVASTVPGVDAVGTFVGGHGIRVQAVMAEIGDSEKIDIIPYDEELKQLITNALSPTEVGEVRINEDDKRAEVFVAEDQLSIAIGKQGQNVRLASKLAGYDIDIKPQSDATKPAADTGSEEPAKQEKKKKKGYVPKAELEESLLSTLENGDDDETKADDQEE